MYFYAKCSIPCLCFGDDCVTEQGKESNILVLTNGNTYQGLNWISIDQNNMVIFSKGEIDAG